MKGNLIRGGGGGERGLDALDYFSSSWKSKPTLSYSCLVKRMFQTGVVFI
jgi:hypothetical protein